MHLLTILTEQSQMEQQFDYNSVMEISNAIKRKANITRLVFPRVDTGWSMKQIDALKKYKNMLFQSEEKQIVQKIIRQEDNCMNFYQILPKEDLPKTLQSATFQSLNTKQNIGNLIRIHKKQKLTKKQYEIRKTLRQNGQIMLLSQIYNYLDEPADSPIIKYQNSKFQLTPLSDVINQLDQWEKSTSKRGNLEARFSKIKVSHANSDQRRNSGHNKSGYVAKKFKIGSDYKSEVEKSLQFINSAHKNEQNQIVKFGLIQNSSKMLKKQLQEMKQIVQNQIQEKLKKLSQSRKQHHRLYEQKLRLQIQQQELDEQIAKQEGASQNNSYGFHSINQNNIKIVFEDKKNQIQKNETKILKIKKTIEFLEEQTIKNQEQLKNILLADVTYYKNSLKNGIDCRESGLVWVIKKLGAQQANFNQLQFPNYLDKRSRTYLITKAKNQELLESILKEKKKFIQQIGKQSEQNFKISRSKNRLPTRKSSLKLAEKAINFQQNDCIRQIGNQCDSSDIPKRYSRSMKKITALREQYVKNQNLLRLTQSREGFKFGNNLAGMTGRQIYNSIAQKIRQMDFAKIKREKSQDKSDKIFEYQSILKKIQYMHMQMQQQDIQQEGYLLSQYKDNKQQFFILAAACFGIKRSYSLIIKNFSWKNTI